MSKSPPFVAQLAQPIDINTIPDYLNDDRWWFEQKLDGERMGIIVQDGQVEGWNRQGGRKLPGALVAAAFKDFNGRWVFDGEHVGGVFWVFDLIDWPKAPYIRTNTNTPYRLRRAALENIITKVIEPQTNAVRLLATKRTTPDKAELVLECIKNNAEGIMLKNANAICHPGKRSRDLLKAKFWESADVVVRVVGREGKSSIAVEVFDEHGEPKDVGSVTVTEKMLNTLKPDDVVEVKYLYVGAGNRLYQPSFLRIRDDKSPEECLLSQLKHVNKAVLEVSQNQT